MYLNNDTFLVLKLMLHESFKERAFDHWGYKESPQQISDIIDVLKGKEVDDIPNRKKRDEKHFYLYD